MLGGVRPINLPAPVRYFRPEQGGVSHFNYWRDNLLLTWMHCRLFCGFMLRLPLLLARRMAARPPAAGGQRIKVMSGWPPRGLPVGPAPI